MHTTSSIALSLPNSSSELITSRDPANGVDAAATTFHEGHGPYQPRCYQLSGSSFLHSVVYSI